MTKLAPLCGIALSVCAATAQSHFTSPPGFESIDGYSWSQISHPLEGSASRNQYTDGDQRGSPKLISRLELRRDAYITPSSTYSARTAMVAVLMAGCNSSTLGTTFASNYAGSPTTVIQRRAIAFPALQAPPPTGPAPWNVVLAFDAAYPYAGTLDLLWEVQADTLSTSNPYALDTMAVPFFVGQGSANYTDPLGSCTTPNGTYSIGYPFSPGTSAGTAQLRVYASGAPSNAPSVLALGYYDPGLRNVFCAPLRTSADVTLPLTSSAGGGLPTLTLTFPWTGGLLQVFAQYASASGGQVFLSDGLCLVIANESYSPRLSRLTAGSAAATTGTRYTSLMPVARFTY